MKTFALGLIIGSVLTAATGFAVELYDRHGNVQAPRGSVQEYDYFTQRQVFLDVQQQRQLQEQGRVESLLQPCVRPR